MTATESVLDVRDLGTYFYGRTITRAVRGISYDVMPGEVMGLVGESGCGKTVSVLSIIGLNPLGSKVISGQALWKGRDLLRMGRREIERIRGDEITVVFQEPLTSFNPVMTVGRQIAEVAEIHEGVDRKQAEQRAIEMLEMTGIPDAEKRAKSYPFQLSGGMRQRAMLSMALLCEPELLIADEPTTAVDVTIQAQLLELIVSLSKEIKTAVILITHNLGVVARYAHRINIMYAGKIVEKGDVIELYTSPRHPYTAGLLKTVPQPDQEIEQELLTIEGQPPPLDHRLPTGCAFHPRCPHAFEKCKQEEPILQEAGGNGHQAACWLFG